MGVKWLCTGRDEHAYNYKTSEGLDSGSVVCLNFKAEIDEEDASGSVNELYTTKPVLTEAGVSALIGLIPYAQGFTVLYDTRLSDLEETGVLEFGESDVDASDLADVAVGDYLGSADEPIS